MCYVNSGRASAIHVPKDKGLDILCQNRVWSGSKLWGGQSPQTRYHRARQERRRRPFRRPLRLLQTTVYMYVCTCVWTSSCTWFYHDYFLHALGFTMIIFVCDGTERQNIFLRKPSSIKRNLCCKLWTAPCIPWWTPLQFFKHVYMHVVGLVKRFSSG